MRLHAPLLSLTIFTVFAAIQAQGLLLHVSPTGMDDAPGTAEAPLATPEGARRAVRQHLATGVENSVTVEFSAGLYTLDAPLALGPGDSFAKDSGRTVTYRAAPGAEVTFSGGRVLGGWQRVEGNLWRAKTDALKPFRDLYSNGVRLQRARHPNGTTLLRVQSVSEDYRTVSLATEDGSPMPEGDWAGPGAELVIYQNWSITRARILRSDGDTLSASVPLGWIGHGDATTVSPGKPCYVEHSRQAIDVPGEWYLDEPAGEVLYLAATDEDPNAATFVAPQSNQWLVLHGTAERPLHGIHFEGITFAHAAWELPEIGYIGIQAGHHGTSIDAPTYVLQHAVELLHTEQSSFTGCTFTRTGAGGVALGRGARDNRVERCTFQDIGGNGVTIGWRGTGEMARDAGDGALSSDWPDAELAPRDNVVTQSTVTRCGAVQHGCVGIFDAFSKRTQITHNHVHELPYTGVSIGFRWNRSPTTQEGALVAHNHIHDTMKLLADGGGIYTLGLQPGAILRGNLIHDIHRSAFAHGGAPNNGIFFDEGTTAVHVEQTIIYNTSGDAIRFNQTSEEYLTWKDNHFGVAPGDPGFPADIAAAAGPRE